MYYLQHERPCCIGRYNSSRRREFVCPIQHGRECSSYELTGEKRLEIDEVYAEKIKVKVYVNQQNSVS